MSTDLKASDKFAKLPLCFAQQFEEKLIPFLQEEHRDLAIETALSLFNQAIWKLQPKSWVLEQVTEGGFVPKQIHVISIRQDSKGQPDGAFHLLGDPVDEIWNLHFLTRADIVNSEE